MTDFKDKPEVSQTLNALDTGIQDFINCPDITPQSTLTNVKTSAQCHFNQTYISLAAIRSLLTLMVQNWPDKPEGMTPNEMTRDVLDTLMDKETE